MARRAQPGTPKIVSNFVLPFRFFAGQTEQLRRTAAMHLALRVGMLPISTVFGVFIENFPAAKLRAHRHFLSNGTQPNAFFQSVCVRFPDNRTASCRWKAANQSPLLTEVEPRAGVAPDHFRPEFAFRQFEKRFAGAMQRHEIIGVDLL